MPIVVRAFPLCRPVDELRAFASALSAERSADTDQFYRRYGISHESWHLQETTNGPWVIGVTMVDKPQEVAPKYAQSSEAFELWFKSQVLQLSGIDPSASPLGPPTVQVFAWSDEERSNREI
jgi:hypothetical protein